MPFIVGWLISIVANPVVRFFEEKIKIKRKAGSALVIISVIAGICLVIYGIGIKLVNEIYGLFTSLPEMWSALELEFAGIGAKWSAVIYRLPKNVIAQVGKIGGNIGETLTSMIGELSVPTAGILGNLAQNIPGIMIAVTMCLLSAYFFVAEKEHISQFIRKYLPLSIQKKCVLIKKTIIDAMVGYLKAQLKIEVWVYLLLVLGFTLLKIQYGYLIALGIAFLDILPVFGTGIILVPWAVVKFLIGQYTYGIGLLALWGISQLLRQIIQPKIMGDSMGISSLPTLILLYAGYRLAGMIGMIAAVPFGILVVTMNEAGFFENTKNSIKILWNGFNQFRQFTPQELEEIKLENTSEGEKNA